MGCDRGKPFSVQLIETKCVRKIFVFETDHPFASDSASLTVHNRMTTYGNVFIFYTEIAKPDRFFAHNRRLYALSGIHRTRHEELGYIYLQSQSNIYIYIYIYCALGVL